VGTLGIDLAITQSGRLKFYIFFVGRKFWQVFFAGSARGVVVYQYTRKKFAKIPQNTQNSSKYTQNYTQVYFIPEIQRK